MSIYKTYKTDTHVFFLNEYVSETNMYDVMEAFEVLDNSQALFYASHLIHMLEYLHISNIIYRDF